MTHLCCRHCRLRFTPAATAYLTACPECDKPLHTIASLELAFGFRVLRVEDLPHTLPEAVAISLPVLDPMPNRRP